MLSTLKRLRGNDADVIVSIEEAVAELRRGRMIIVTDSEDRENEGDLVCCAEDITPEMVNFMAQYGRGLICVPLSEERADALALKPMVDANEDQRRTAFTVSVDARANTTTGISAHDRYETIRLLADPAANAGMFTRPGHIFPLVARPGGVLVRAGHTEASVDFCELAGKRDVGVICEIMNPDGTMARMPDLVKFARKHKLRITTIEALIAYRRTLESIVQVVHESEYQSPYGLFRKVVYQSVDGRTHFALIKGKISARTAIPVRIHSENAVRDLLEPDADRASVPEALSYLGKSKAGVFVFISESDSALLRRLKSLGSAGAREDVLRNFGIGAQILNQLGLRQIRLITNNPKRLIGLEAYNIGIRDTIPIDQVRK